MKIEEDKTMGGWILVFVCFLGFAIGTVAMKANRDAKINALEDTIKTLQESNDFKYELIRAYEAYSDDDCSDNWAVIDSLYRTQI